MYLYKLSKEEEKSMCKGMHIMKMSGSSRTKFPKKKAEKKVWGKFTGKRAKHELLVKEFLESRGAKY